MIENIIISFPEWMGWTGYPIAIGDEITIEVFSYDGKLFTRIFLEPELFIKWVVEGVVYNNVRHLIITGLENA